MHTVFLGGREGFTLWYHWVPTILSNHCRVTSFVMCQNRVWGGMGNCPVTWKLRFRVEYRADASPHFKTLCCRVRPISTLVCQSLCKPCTLYAGTMCLHWSPSWIKVFCCWEWLIVLWILHAGSRHWRQNARQQWYHTKKSQGNLQ